MGEIKNNDFDIADIKKMERFAVIMEQLVKNGEKVDQRLKEISDIVLQNSLAIAANTASFNIMKKIVFGIFGVTVLIFMGTVFSAVAKEIVKKAIEYL